ncbi:MAG: hypothetical protein ACEQSC_00515 [Candidatus Nanopelagicaceae bacterium]
MSQIINQLIKAQLSRDGTSGGRGTVVPLHCAQMREYGSRGGRVQFDCPQDDDANSRGNAIKKWYESNDLASKMDYVFDVFTCWGEVLWLILPLNDGDYWIEFFQGGLKHDNPQFKIYYKNGGREIETAVIRYSYQKDNDIGSGAIPMGGGGNTSTTTRWVKLIINSESIVTMDCGSEPDLTLNRNQYAVGNNVKIDPNPFAPILPIALSVNNPQQTGRQGTGDFHVFAALIENYEERLAWVDENLETFGNPSLVTTRSAAEVMETNMADTPNTWAANQGFRDGVGDGYSGSSSKSLAGRRGTKGKRISKVIGNVNVDERFGYIQTSPIPGDLTTYIRNDRELIHWCLGGVDPVGISTNPTFGEIKTLFGRVQNTANKKASSLFNTLGRLFAIAIGNEEQRFKAAFMISIANSPELLKQIPDPQSISDEQCQSLYQLFRKGALEPLGFRFTPIGLPPMGDRSVSWRHTVEVYKPSTRDLLDLSIVGRNMREDGLNQEFVTGKLYPEMSPKDIQAATSGFSPRVVENQLNGLNSLLQFNQQCMQVPGIQDPKIPLAIELGIAQLIATGIESLKKELNYGRPIYTAAAASTTPDSLSEFISGSMESVSTTSSNPTISLPAAGGTT